MTNYGGVREVPTRRFKISRMFLKGESEVVNRDAIVEGVKGRQHDLIYRVPGTAQNLRKVRISVQRRFAIPVDQEDVLDGHLTPSLGLDAQGVAEELGMR